MKLGFKDGGRDPENPYDTDYQDMAIKVTISPAEAAVPATSPQGLLALTLFLAVAVMWRFRKGRWN